MEDNGIDINKIVSIATDGARSMTGIHRGVTSILQRKINLEILTFHCIIHQEALCAQTFPAEIVEVMNLLIKIITSILAKALYHRQFKDFLEGIDSQFSDLLLHNKVRWLSRGNVLQRFALSEIKTFLNEKSIDHPELEEDKWLQKKLTSW
ncbi:General transcription factor II-I repeat domain-containing protein 2A [Araneus ventricosus]|uniref:General transcription factor II-I repeat domain-containing protein 2A n=1 Tax=Araneus ventricosus TaxID=182803 RepID=A0A4Y2VB61_ARAVE|nr:General transcription factor II-I repeat domain-containing protein 2A [Araneus ventricosus]